MLPDRVSYLGPLTYESGALPIALRSPAFIKELFKNTCYSYFRQVNIKFLYNSKFDFTAKSLVTNTVVIRRVLCINCLYLICAHFKEILHI